MYDKKRLASHLEDIKRALKDSGILRISRGTGPDCPYTQCKGGTDQEKPGRALYGSFPLSSGNQGPGKEI